MYALVLFLSFLYLFLETVAMEIHLIVYLSFFPSIY